MTRSPPGFIDGARVLEYAIVDESVKFTGRLHLYHADKRVGPVPRLAICRNPGMNELLLFHCDAAWNVQGTQIWNASDKPAVTSVEEVKKRAEQAYAGISSKCLGCAYQRDKTIGKLADRAALRPGGFRRRVTRCMREQRGYL